MKVLAIFPGYEPAWAFGGVARSGGRLCRALASEGVDVTVYTTNLNGAGGTLDMAVRQPVDRGGGDGVVFSGLVRPGVSRAGIDGTFATNGG